MYVCVFNQQQQQQQYIYIYIYIYIYMYIYICICIEFADMPINIAAPYMLIYCLIIVP